MTRRDQKTVTVLLDPDEFERFEGYCESQGFKKSTLIARLIREHMDTAGYQLQKVLPLSQQQPRTTR
ncbi:CopG family transcriptional regulator [uncultured Pseudacidovorax sp.]|uniref:CopG family transcriptional regulator n=1 Tax=uncultured Pseudacidovorax sp. TaxID=679313 RepID=UPI0025DE1E87|nr:CopG family transcriptional regulator [uncultured Pseudacidovorax sp.]